VKKGNRHAQGGKRLPRLKILEVDFHRNGVCGEGFWAVRFKDEVEGYGVGPIGKLAPGPREFMAMVFSREIYGVVCLDMIPEMGVGLGNHWRGDYYIGRLWAAIKRHDKLLRSKLYGTPQVGERK
jgi:hypothetical protein